MDEANSALGMAIADDAGGPYRDIILELQNDLFDVGSDLCVPGEMGDRLRVPAAYTARLEGHIDRFNADLAPLNSFVLPGGTRMSAWLHVARTVVRRAERLVTALCEVPSEVHRVNTEVVHYLNRLSDLLFVLGRHANERGARDVLWQPGKNRG